MDSAFPSLEGFLFHFCLSADVCVCMSHECEAHISFVELEPSHLKIFFLVIIILSCFCFFQLLACLHCSIRYDLMSFFDQSNIGPEKEFFLVTNPESSGSPPSRAPPSIPVATSSCIVSNVSQPESFEPPHDQELTVDDIDDFEDDEEEEEVDSLRNSRPQPSDVGDISPRLPLFATGNLIKNVHSFLLNI